MFKVREKGNIKKPNQWSGRWEEKKKASCYES